MTSQVLPSGFHSVTPRIVVADVAAQVEFLRVVFDASGDVNADRPADIRIGNSRVLISRVGERERSAHFCTSMSRIQIASTNVRLLPVRSA